MEAEGGLGLKDTIAPSRRTKLYGSFQYVLYSPADLILRFGNPQPAELVSHNDSSPSVLPASSLGSDVVSALLSAVKPSVILAPHELRVPLSASSSSFWNHAPVDPRHLASLVAGADYDMEFTILGGGGDDEDGGGGNSSSGAAGALRQASPEPPPAWVGSCDTPNRDILLSSQQAGNNGAFFFVPRMPRC